MKGIFFKRDFKEKYENIQGSVLQVIGLGVDSSQTSVGCLLDLHRQLHKSWEVLLLVEREEAKRHAIFCGVPDHADFPC